MREAKMKKMILMLCVCMLGVAYADGPNYKDTVEFIYEKANLVWKDGNGKVTKEQKIKVDECTLILLQEYYGELGNAYKMIIPLKEIDPTRNEVGNQFKEFKDIEGVKIYVKNNREILKYFFKKGNRYYSCSSMENSPCADNLSDAFIFALSPEELNAPKLSKALKHLVKLCGGKGELF